MMMNRRESDEKKQEIGRWGTSRFCAEASHGTMMSSPHRPLAPPPMTTWTTLPTTTTTPSPSVNPVCPLSGKCRQAEVLFRWLPGLLNILKALSYCNRRRRPSNPRPADTAISRRGQATQRGGDVERIRTYTCEWVGRDEQQGTKCGDVEEMYVCQEEETGGKTAQISLQATNEPFPADRKRRGR